MNKKLFILAAAILSVGSLASCGGGTTSSSSTPTTSEAPFVNKIEAKLKTDKVYHVGETLNKSDIEVKASISDGTTKIVGDAEWTSDTFGSSSTHVITAQEASLRLLQLQVGYGGQLTDFSIDTFDYKCTPFEWNEIIDFYQTGNSGKNKRNFLNVFTDCGATVTSYVADDKVKYVAQQDQETRTKFFYKDNLAWVTVEEKDEAYTATMATTSIDTDVHLMFLDDIKLDSTDPKDDTRSFDETTHTYSLQGEDPSHVKLEMYGGKIYMTSVTIGDGETGQTLSFSDFNKVEVTIPQHSGVNRAEVKQTQDPEPISYLGVEGMTLVAKKSYVIMVDFEKLHSGMSNPNAYLGKYFAGKTSYIKNVDSIILNGKKMLNGYQLNSNHIEFTYDFQDSDKLAFTVSVSNDTFDVDPVYSFVLIEESK